MTPLTGSRHRHAPGLASRQIALPVPFPVKTANVYLIAAPAGTVLVDTGYYSRQAWDRLTRQISGFTARWGRLRMIVLTHHHPDHVGMAGRLQQHYGVPVLASGGEAALIAEVWTPEVTRDTIELYRRHGMPSTFLEETGRELEGILVDLSPLPEVDSLPAAPSVTVAGLALCPLITPGHSPAHLCLFHGPSGILIAGDHLLPRITPNIGWYTYSGPDPLREFLAALGAVDALPVRRALPGHGLIIPAPKARIAELRVHHAARLAAVRALLAGRRLTGYEVAQGIFGTALRPGEARLALVEALAHLQYLRSQEDVEAAAGRGSVVYFRAAGRRSTSLGAVKHDALVSSDLPAGAGERPGVYPHQKSW